MRQIFKDPELQKVFERDGYVKIPAFLKPPQIAPLLQLREQVRDEYRTDDQFYIIINSGDLQLKKKVYALVKETLGGNSSEYLLDYQPVIGSMFIKCRGEHSQKEIHQDLSYADERSHITLTIWSPLVDADTSNGCMWMFKGSNRLVKNIRYLPSTEWEYDDVKEMMWDFLVPEPMQAGDALIYDSSLVHASKPNLSGKERVAVAMMFSPVEAELYFYQRKAEAPGTRLVKYRITPEFYFNDYKQGLINDQPVEEFDYAIKKISKEELKHFVEKNSLSADARNSASVF